MHIGTVAAQRGDALGVPVGTRAHERSHTAAAGSVHLGAPIKQRDDARHRPAARCTEERGSKVAQVKGVYVCASRDQELHNVRRA